MVFPIIPLYSQNPSSFINERPYLTLTGQALLKASQLDKDAIKQFVSEYGSTLTLISVLIENSALFSDDDIVELLNNGVTTFFLQDATYASRLVEEIGVPTDRLALLEGSVYKNQFGVKNDFKLQDIVPVERLDSKVLTQSILSSLRTDRTDGLYTTLVVDTSERCLGLVYSSKESIEQAVDRKVGVYYSRSRKEIWIKGLTSGNTQKLVSIQLDCDADALKFVVVQEGRNSSFCHLETESCFGQFKHGLAGLEKLLQQRKLNAPPGSYTSRLFNDPALLTAKIKEEAEELTEAKDKNELSWEAADLFYFALAKLVANDVSLSDVETNLHMKHLKITRRKGDAKPKFVEKSQESNSEVQLVESLKLATYKSEDKESVNKALTRPIQRTSQIMHLVNPIIDNVKKNGDKALVEYAAKFDGVQLKNSVIESPFPEEFFEGLTPEMKESLDLSMENVRKFHAAQLIDTMQVETQPGVVCSRFARPIEKVGLYIPGGTAVLPSTALMLGIPAQVAQCREIVFASPPRKSDGKISPEVAYIAQQVGASKIVLAGGAQAVAAMAYGTESVPKVDKILGPGNQFVTAAKMYVQNDTQALCSIDMPAGPSEVLVVCDEDADVDFVASDLLSQAEHGVDSQVILLGVQLSERKVEQIQTAVRQQTLQLPRKDIVVKCIAHSSIIVCNSYEEAFKISNQYAPEHLILQIKEAANYVRLVNNAGSVFVGAYTPESCGDYSSGTNHTLPTYGYARQYSGVNTSTFQKYVTAQSVSPQGLDNIGRAVMSVAQVEGLDAHRNAVKIRMSKLGLLPEGFQ
ncbi:trifunctional histidinol dehydrogenase [Zygosaccharomyces mellis]|uniref:Histidine biosynthesis trifunctional protein n=1 Tax=Zygosaccharomyces mellis TaxID=42258 RepID=A0A4C2ECX0_9SACH|nr:trifunctional histidinol dehydrogenase [Zygosaccharomyces mellis]